MASRIKGITGEIGVDCQAKLVLPQLVVFYLDYFNPSRYNNRYIHI